MPTLTIIMKKSEYFSEISKQVHERRKKDEMSSEEKAAFEEGRKAALKSVLIEMGRKKSVSELLQDTEKFQKFLYKEKNKANLAVGNMDVHFWEGSYQYTSQEYHNFLLLQIRNIQTRLKKSREIHAVNVRLLQEFSQLTID